MPGESLLSPPSTVNISNIGGIDNYDDGIPVDDVPAEVSAIKDSPFTRDWNKENLSAAEASPDIESVINSFNKELENLSRSFDLLASSHNNAKAEQASAIQTPTYQPTRSYNNYSTSRRTTSTSVRTPYNTPNDPPTSVDRTSPLRFSTNSTPQRGSSRRNNAVGNQDSSGMSYRSFTTPSEPPPPPPVDTPAVALPHPFNESEKVKNGRRSYPSEWEVTLDRMKETLAEQERKIQYLQRENEDLKRLLMMHDSSGRTRTPYQNYDSNTDDPRRRSHFFEESIRVPTSSFSTFRSTQLSTPPRDEDDVVPARRIDVIPEEYAEFTPGTKFVAELARLMKMENGHHAPLSVMIDKHWDRLKYHLRDDARF